jgi:hypothetical protein
MGVRARVVLLPEHSTLRSPVVRHPPSLIASITSNDKQDKRRNNRTSSLRLLSRTQPCQRNGGDQISSSSAQEYHVQPPSSSLIQTHSTHTSPITYSSLPNTNSKIKNVDKSTVEASTYEGKLVFKDLHLEEGVYRTRVINCRCWINLVSLLKSQSRK